jgi:vacuolar protein sorting-associated protein 53
MDPPGPGALGGSLVSPGGSRVSLPLAVSGPGGESLFSSLASPAITGATTGASVPDPAMGRTGERREVFSDFKRFVSFGLRKDSSTPQ